MTDTDFQLYVELPSIKYADVEASRRRGNPRPRLDADGYTRRDGSPTRWEVQLRGESRWRRVYILQFSNAGSLFVHRLGEHLYLSEFDLREDGR